MSSTTTTPLTVPYTHQGSLGVKSSDPLLIQTHDLYQTLVGIPFIGVYMGNWPLQVKQSNTIETTDSAGIAIRFDSHNITSTLSSIILQDPLHRVWKAVTGPNEFDTSGEYWLWTQTPIKGAVKSRRQMYTIVGVSCITGMITHRMKSHETGFEITVEAGEVL